MPSAADTPWYTPLKRAIVHFIDDDALTYAAALAFYTALSFAPLLVVLFACLSLFLGDAAQQELVNQIGSIAGKSAAEIAHDILESGESRPQLSSFAGIAGAVALLVSATGVFAQLQAFLNSIWGVTAKPGNSVWDWLRKRVLSLGMIIALGFLLLVSLGVSAAIQLILSAFGLEDRAGWLWVTLDSLISVGIFFVVFVGMFRYLPDVKIRWSDVWRGALLTALLFALGKWAIGKYLGVTSIGSAYGAAGSFVLLLVWVYYSAIIVFFGAEMTEAWAHRRGHEIRPEEHAMQIDDARGG